VKRLKLGCIRCPASLIAMPWTRTWSTQVALISSETACLLALPPPAPPPSILPHPSPRPPLPPLSPRPLPPPSQCPLLLPPRPLPSCLCGSIVPKLRWTDSGTFRHLESSDWCVLNCDSRCFHLCNDVLIELKLCWLEWTTLNASAF